MEERHHAPASVAPVAPPSDVEALQCEVEGLASLDLAELRSRWRRAFHTPPPARLPRPLLLRLLAYKLQARASGDLDRDTARVLDRLARDHARRREAGVVRNPKLPPPVPPPLATPACRAGRGPWLAPPVRRERGLKPGTLLVGHHGGAQHRVVVLPEGYLWEGRTFTSLSGIARAITGTRWNGPRFFGLREDATSTARDEGA